MVSEYPPDSRPLWSTDKNSLLRRSGTIVPSLLSSFGELTVALRKDEGITTDELIHRSDVSYGAVKAVVVVCFDEIGHNTSGLFQAQRRFGPDALRFQ